MQLSACSPVSCLLSVLISYCYITCCIISVVKALFITEINKYFYLPELCNYVFSLSVTLRFVSFCLEVPVVIFVALLACYISVTSYFSNQGIYCSHPNIQS